MTKSCAIPGARTKARLLDDFSQFHVIHNFHGQTAVGAAGFIGGALEELECANPDISARIGIGHAIRIDGNVKRHAKKSNKHRLPEANHFDVAHEREVLQVARFRECNGAAQNIRFETHIGISEEQPIAVGGFVSFLEGVRFAEPAGG